MTQMTDEQRALVADQLASADTILAQVVPSMLARGMQLGEISSALLIATTLFTQAVTPEQMADEHAREQVFDKQLNVMRSLNEMLAKTALPKGLFTATFKSSLELIRAKH